MKKLTDQERFELYKKRSSEAALKYNTKRRDMGYIRFVRWVTPEYAEKLQQIIKEGRFKGELI